MTTFSIRYETSNSCRLIGIVNHAPTAGDALESWAQANDLKIKIEVEFKDERPMQARAYARIMGGRTGRLVASARGDHPMTAGAVERKYPGPHNKNPYPKLTIPIWLEGTRQSHWSAGDNKIEQWPAGDLAHKPLVDWRVDFPGDEFHRPGEPDVVDIPRNAAGLTTVEAEYDRAMRDLKEQDEPDDLWVGDSMARALHEEEEERRLDNEASQAHIAKLEKELQDCRRSLGDAVNNTAAAITMLKERDERLEQLLAFMLDQQAAGARYASEQLMGEIGRSIKLQTMISMSRDETKSLPERIEAAFLLGEMVAREQARTYDDDEL